MPLVVSVQISLFWRSWEGVQPCGLHIIFFIFFPPLKEIKPSVWKKMPLSLGSCYLVLHNKKINPHFFQFQRIDPLASIQMSGICVKTRGSPLTKPVKVGFALVETPQQFLCLVKIRICQISLPEAADF